jgi:predicted dehydrogenase
MTEKPLNVGFLGVGALAAKQHVPNTFANPRLKVHTLCDLDEARLAFYRDRYHPERVTKDYRAMFADPEVDLVVIAMSPTQHARFSVEALDAGKHVYVEKPLAVEVGAALDVARAARRNGRRVAVGFNRRFAPAYVDARAALRGDAGPLLITYRMVDDMRDRSAWYRGRPRLIDEACHVFDVCNWLAGAEPVNVYAIEAGRPQDHHVVVAYANGVSASAALSFYGSFAWPKERLEIVGDNKVVGVEDFVELQAAGVPGLTQKNYPGREYDGFTRGYAEAYERVGLPFYREVRRRMNDLLLGSDLLETARDRDKWEAVAEAFPDHFRIPVNYSCDKGWYQALDHFGGCLLEGRAPGTADAQDAAKAIAMGLAAMESIRERRPVALDPAAWAL